MKRKNLIFSLFALALLCGCTREEKAAEPPEPAVSANYGYVYQSAPLPGDMALAVSQFADGNEIYLCGMDRQDAPLVYRTDGENVFAYALPDGIDYVQACCLTEDGLTVLAGDRPAFWCNAKNYPCDNRQSTYHTCLLTYDREGQLLSQIPLPEALCSGAHFYSLCYADGFYYLLNETDLIQLSAEGSIQNTKHFEGSMFVAQATAGQGYALAYFHSSMDGGDDTVKIDVLQSPESFTFQTVLSDADQDVYGVGFSDSGEMIVRTADGLQLLSADSESRTSLYSFRENGIGAPFCNFYPCTGGLLLVSSNQTSLSRLVWGEIYEKTELVLWVRQESDYLSDMVSGFNRTNRQYRVRMENVSGKSADQLRAEILSGGGPDLYFTGAGNAALDLSSDGAFEDLLPYLDGSESFSRDSFVPSVLDAMRSGGKLYSIPVSMEIYTLLCRDTGLAAPDLPLSRMLDLPEVQNGAWRVFTQEYTRDSVWEWLSNMYLAGHIDEAAGTCAFDTQAYQELLTVCKAASSAEPASDEIPCLLSPEHIVGVLRLMVFQQAYGDKFAFLQGYGTALKIWDAFAVSNTSPHKDGTWQFIEYALSLSAELGEKQFLLPVTKEGLSKLLDDASTEGVWNYETNAYELMRPYTRAQFESLLEQDAVVMGKYSQLEQIMREEAEKFFAGDRSAAEAAKMTQSRASIYMAEQYG